MNNMIRHNFARAHHFIMRHGMRAVFIILAAQAVLLVVSVLFFGAAQAAESAPPPASALATDSSAAPLLKQIFGDLVSDGGGSTLFGAYAAHLNILAASIGGIMIAWFFIAGTVNTASDGEVMGKNWSSVWVPLRFTVAMLCLVPLPSGWIAIQLGIVNVASAGAGAADWVWRATVENFVKGGLSVAAVSPPSGAETVEKALALVTCTQAMNALYRSVNIDENPRIELRAGWHPTRHPADVPNSAKILAPLHAVGAAATAIARGEGAVADAAMKVTGGVKTEVWRWSADLVTSKHSVPGACGSIEYHAVNKEGKVGGEFEEIAKPIRVAHASAIAKLVTDSSSPLQTLSAELRALSFPNANLDTPLSDEQKRRLWTLYTNAVEQYDNEVAEAARAALISMRADSAKTDSMIRKLSALGWLGAGQYYMTISRLNREVFDASAAKAEITLPSPEKLASGRLTLVLEQIGVRNALGPVVENWSHVRAFATGRIEPGKSYSDVEGAFNAEKMNGLHTALGEVDKSAASLFSSLSKWLANGVKMLSFAGPVLADDGMFIADPLGELTAYGQKIMDATLLLLLGGIALTAVFSAVGAGPIVGFVMAALFTSLFAAGAYLGVILPLQPFILWIIAVAGWLILVVEAVVGGALWALAHLRPEGNGLSGDGARGGWNLLLNIALRPVLMIGGLFGGMAVFTVVAGLFLKYWDEGSNMALGGSVGPIMQIIVIIAMTAAIAFVAQKCIRFISWLPDTVIRWFGAQSERLFDEQDADKAVAVVGGGVNKMSEAGQRGAGLKSDIDQDKDRRDRRSGGGGGAGGGGDAGGGGGGGGGAAAAATGPGGAAAGISSAAGVAGKAAGQVGQAAASTGTGAGQGQGEGEEDEREKE
jgi:conjugal transfer/type IV secretion protein DotA/TraY